MLEKIKHRWENFRIRKTLWAIKKNYRASECKQKELNEKKEIPFFRNYVYKDERWNYVAHMAEYLDCIRYRKPVLLENNSCDSTDRCLVTDERAVSVFSSSKMENWVYFASEEPLGHNYVFSFDIRLLTEFSEIQTAFCYRSLGDRLRFQIRNNKEAVFECIREGKFYNHIFSKPVTLSLHEFHHISLKVFKNEYSYLVDGQEIFHIKSWRKDRRMGKGLCLILYHRDLSSEVRCEIKNAVIEIPNRNA